MSSFNNQTQNIDETKNKKLTVWSSYNITKYHGETERRKITVWSSYLPELEEVSRKLNVIIFEDSGNNTFIPKTMCTLQFCLNDLKILSNLKHDESFSELLETDNLKYAEFLNRYCKDRTYQMKNIKFDKYSKICSLEDNKLHDPKIFQESIKQFSRNKFLKPNQVYNISEFDSVVTKLFQKYSDEPSRTLNIGICLNKSCARKLDFNEYTTKSWTEFNQYSALYSNLA